MGQVTFEIPEDAVQALRLPPGEVGSTVRFAAAAKLYELRRLSSGAAAALAGVPRVVFLGRLAEYGVDAIDLTAEELAKETRLA